MWPDSLTPRVLVASPPPVDTRSGAMAGFDVPGGSAAMPRPERVARLQPGLAGFGSTTAAGGVTGAPAGKTAGWTRTPGFSLCCYHVNPRTYRTTSVFGEIGRASRRERV